MGQVHSAAGDGGDEDGDEDEDGDGDEGRRRIDVSGWAGSIPRGAAAESTPSGSALNRFKQPILQK
jgi:hypothetical protein